MNESLKVSRRTTPSIAFRFGYIRIIIHARDEKYTVYNKQILSQLTHVCFNTISGNDMHVSFRERIAISGRLAPFPPINFSRKLITRANLSAGIRFILRICYVYLIVQTYLLPIFTYACARARTECCVVEDVIS